MLIPKECVLKVFKTTLNEFKNRDKYIKDDYRFKDRFSKLNPRKIIHLWAEKEMHNLTRLDSSTLLQTCAVLYYYNFWVLYLLISLKVDLQWCLEVCVQKKPQKMLIQHFSWIMDRTLTWPFQTLILVFFNYFLNRTFIVFLHHPLSLELQFTDRCTDNFI